MLAIPLSWVREHARSGHLPVVRPMRRRVLFPGAAEKAEVRMFGVAG